MNCHECEALLQRQLDNELGAEPELEPHLAECGRCRGLFTAAQQLRDGLARMVMPLPPPALASRTVLMVLRERQGRRRLRQAAAMAMMAACLLIAVWYWHDRAQQPAPEVVIAAAKVVPAKEPTLGESMREARAALDQLADKMFDATRQQADILRDATVPLETARPDNAQQRPTTDPPLARSRSGMTTGLQTVAASTRRGLSFILRETPPLAAGKKDVD
jgi:hypothetical protein